MAGENPHEAFDNFRQPLQRALSCVNADAHLWALVGSNGYSPGQEHTLVPNRGEPVKLSSERNLSLMSSFVYRVVEAESERGPWKVQTTAYRHALEDGNALEIIAYHWHPSQGSAYNFPHLHIGTGIGASLSDVHKYHVPTGRIAFEDVLRFAIRDLDVQPVRDAWEEVFDETRGRFETWRTWSGSGPQSS